METLCKARLSPLSSSGEHSQVAKLLYFLLFVSAEAKGVAQDLLGVASKVCTLENLS